MQWISKSKSTIAYRLSVTLLAVTMSYSTSYIYYTLLSVTEESHAPSDPVVWILHALEHQGSDVGEVGAPWLLVHWTHVQLGVQSILCVHSIDMHNWDGSEEHFGGGLSEAAVLTIPTSTIQEQAKHVDTLCWWSGDVVLVHARHIVVHHHRVQGPALVCPRHLLPHGRHKALWVEEARHPEAAGPAIKHPATELSVSLQQLSVPETDGGGVPGNL